MQKYSIHRAVRKVKVQIQNVVNRGALRLSREACHSYLTKIPLTYSVSYLNLRGLELSLGDLSLPVATGLCCVQRLYSYIFSKAGRSMLGAVKSSLLCVYSIILPEKHCFYVITIYSRNCSILIIVRKTLNRCCTLCKSVTSTNASCN